MKACKVVRSRQQTENSRNDQEANECRQAFPKTGQEIGPVRRIDIGGSAVPDGIKIKRQCKRELSAIADCKRKKGPGQKGSRPNQNKVQRRHLAEQREPERELPGAPEAQIAPRPRPKDREQPKQDPSNERLAPNFR